ncbi:hypothetical protein MJP36_04895 [Pseudomonas palleroniana]|uniref:hypothetical protein n=1 Tax=Pseudomonas palleroniana TaxID=191390 RepID=UPI001FCC2FC2|nr:hypothetical protein [Pseudomonas palleroniana]UOK40965.1 hypothetical protein MJP36_04895 [Pseudomonas palleroniana]
MTEEEMRHALFGSAAPAEQLTVPQIQPHVVVAPSTLASKRKEAKPFAPKLQVLLRVGSEFERKTELFTYEADTLSTLQAELDATKMARKKYRFIEVVSVKPAK